MAYSTIEAALLTIIQLHADFDSSNSSRGDYRIIGHGKARCVVLSYGRHSREEISLGLEKNIWEIDLDMYVPWPGENTTLETNFQTERQKIIDQVAKYPRLNACSGVIRAMIVTGEDPAPLPDSSSYKGQRFICRVEEMVDPNRQE